MRFAVHHLKRRVGVCILAHHADFFKCAQSMKLKNALCALICTPLFALLPACKPASSASTSAAPQASVPPITPTHSNLAYAGTTNPAQMLDLYLPTATVQPAEHQRRPLVLFIHGGAWMVGDKAWMSGGTHMQLEQLLRLLLDNGYAVASVNYRLIPEGVFPAPIHDVKAAVRYLRAHAAELGIDSERIAVAGESAGGHLAQLLAVSAGEPSLEGTLGNSAFSSRVKAAISYYGIADLRHLPAERAAQGCPNPWGYDPNKPHEAEYGLLGGGALDTPERQQQALLASPIHYVSAGDPPMLLLHGRQDCVVAYVQSQAMAAVLQKAGVPSQLQLIDAGHADAKFYTDPQLQSLVLVFLQKYL